MDMENDDANECQESSDATAKYEVKNPTQELQASSLANIRLTRCRQVLPRSLLITSLLFSTVALAADWPPVLDPNSLTTQTENGRRIERYTHGPRADWGYADGWRYSPPQETGKEGQNRNSFYVVSPKHPRPRAPLCVVLHSANRTAFDYLGFQFLSRKVDPADDPSAIMTRVPEDCYALYLNSTNEEWYGWSVVHRDPAKYAHSLTPAEKRLIDTIAWVITRYKIDRNRVYLAGVSMGGCAALALGLSRGNLFAAILVDVPAGTEFAALRFGLPGPDATSAGAAHAMWIKRMSGFGLPDPPIVVDFFAQNDPWSRSQPLLLRAASAGRFPLVAAWGPFGHTAFSTAIAKYPQDDVALAFPWSNIRKDAAYPVFTHASSDQRLPLMGGSGGFDESGQINAYFRWKNLQDRETKFAIELWLAHPAVANPPHAMPETSTVDITLRRLQLFRVHPGKVYRWRLLREGKSVASGTVSPDAANLLTIPRVTLNLTPAKLMIE
jgi:poly(3-hydroxybutyrate) depolymerase